MLCKTLLEQLCINVMQNITRTTVYKCYVKQSAETCNEKKKTLIVLISMFKWIIKKAPSC